MSSFQLKDAFFSSKASLNLFFFHFQIYRKKYSLYTVDCRFSETSDFIFLKQLFYSLCNIIFEWRESLYRETIKAENKKIN